MTMKKANAAMDILILLTGLYYSMKTIDSPQTFMIALPYVCIGVGSGNSKKPNMQRQMEIAVLMIGFTLMNVGMMPVLLFVSPVCFCRDMPFFIIANMKKRCKKYAKAGK